MNKFIPNILLAFRVIINPSKYRAPMTNEARNQGIELYYYFIFPLVLLASLADGFHYYFIDGQKNGFFAFSISLFAWIFLIAILICGISFLLKRAKVYSHLFTYCLSFALIWLPLSEIVQLILGSSFGIIGRFLGGWPVILGSIWLANFCIKEIIFEMIPLEISKMKSLFNKITIFLIILVIVIPYLSEKLIELVVLNVL